MAIVIEKRISLESLGEKYASSYLTFRSISLKELETLRVEMAKLEKDESNAIPFMVTQLKDRFLSGEIDGQKVSADDIEDLPVDFAVDCFKQMLGQLDPKV